MRDWVGEGWLRRACRIASPNHGPRPEGAAVSLVVLHNISLPPDRFGRQWVERFFLNRLDPSAHPYFASIAAVEVSSHFYVRRSGRLVQFVACDRRAWHAGQSCWRGRDNCNDYSVGIELEGSDTRRYTAAQYRTLWRVLDALRARYPIDAIAGHCHVAPGRKTDPGPCFDWSALRLRYADLRLPAEIAG